MPTTSQNISQWWRPHHSRLEVEQTYGLVGSDCCRVEEAASRNLEGRRQPKICAVLPDTNLPWVMISWGFSPLKVSKTLSPKLLCHLSSHIGRVLLPGNFVLHFLSCLPREALNSFLLDPLSPLSPGLQFWSHPKPKPKTLVSH